MNRAPGISVIIPTLNRPELLIRCVESINNQTFKGEINCIVVDSSDNDKTELAVKNFDITNKNFSLKYLGSSYNSFGDGAWNGQQQNLIKISIFSDNSDSPGSELIATSNFGDYFGSGDLVDFDGNTVSNLESLRLEAFFGNAGLAVTSGQKLWVVIEQENSTDGGSRGNSPVGFAERKVSSDGINWSEYIGNANGRYSDNMPMVLLTD